MIENPRGLCRDIVDRLRELRVSLDIDGAKKEIQELEARAARENFWDDQQEAQRVLKRISEIKEDVEAFETLYDQAVYLNDLLDMAEQEEEEELYRQVVSDLEVLYKEFQKYEMLILFSGEHDRKDAIVTLHAGAGGTEAQDWVEMLFRMYTRWAEDSGYQVEILDYLAGDEAGIKSVTFLVKGDYAYGKLKCEEGVHRLIRISPFDASGRRHTSFASLSVLPEISETVEVNIDPDDLRIDTFRSGGAGGQHVNKTDSAVRITHIPTGIVVQCQNERSQHANRLAAMKILQAKLYELKQREMEENLQKLKGEYKEIAWGSQIRTYTLNPFTLVKDHRTGLEVGNANAVLDGNLDEFISACLRSKNKLV
ncbi:MAG TPA: peptide chain release factor 2 [Syntrophomonadaceae bacterium]|nr:peptide chain release factor 2 [Syntrophomonadaceae bacterium]HOQ10406.1 peptide chain release factor 2 [Syntrophomonadaceae bacterium]HPU49664.1 peptide chain release factor 2 [Syntrophomonadaceae bacterium]